MVSSLLYHWYTSSFNFQDAWPGDSKGTGLVLESKCHLLLYFLTTQKYIYAYCIWLSIFPKHHTSKLGGLSSPISLKCWTSSNQAKKFRCDSTKESNQRLPILRGRYSNLPMRRFTVKVISKIKFWPQTFQIRKIYILHIPLFFLW